MRGDSHVRFLGGGGAVMRRRYPTISASGTIRRAHFCMTLSGFTHAFSCVAVTRRLQYC